MSWLCKPGEDLFDTFKERFSPEELQELNDPTASIQSSMILRRDIEQKYGLDAARVADSAIQAAQHAERQKNLQIWTARQARQQVKRAEEAVKDQEEILNRARAEVERLIEVAEVEEEVVQLTTRNYEDMRQEADQRFDEFYSAAKKGKIIDMEGQWEKASCRTLEDPIHPSSEVVFFQPRPRLGHTPGQVQPLPAARPSGSSGSRRDVTTTSPNTPTPAIQASGNRTFATPASSSRIGSRASGTAGKGIGEKRARPTTEPDEHEARSKRTCGVVKHETTD